MGENEDIRKKTVDEGSDAVRRAQGPFKLRLGEHPGGDMAGASTRSGAGISLK